MSDGTKEETMAEKYLDLQYKLIDTKIDNITNTLANLGSDVKKVLDDHEQRLREKTRNDATTAQMLSSFQTQHKELESEHDLFKLSVEKRFEAIERDKDERTKTELTIWQSIGVEAIKYLAFGAGGGGVIVLVVKLFGIVI